MYGESFRKTAARELNEEVGVEVAIDDLRLIHVDQSFLDRDYVNLTFVADAWSGQPRICEPEKCSAIGWFATDDLPEKSVNVVRVNERAGFTDALTYSTTDQKAYESFMGGPLEP